MNTIMDHTKCLTEYFIKTYGEKSVKQSHSIPNKDCQTLIDIKCFESITCSKFREFIDKYDLYVDLNDLVKYLKSGASNVRNTRGKYHELLHLIVVMYGKEKDDDGLLDFLRYDKKIYPCRVEYIICYWILWTLRNDPFISKYDIAVPTFQKLINDNDERYYDIVFDSLHIYLEIQEIVQIITIITTIY